MAASPGFEPRYQHPECRVLPLDDEAIICPVLNILKNKCQNFFNFTKQFLSNIFQVNSLLFNLIIKHNIFMIIDIKNEEIRHKIGFPFWEWAIYGNFLITERDLEYIQEIKNHPYFSTISESYRIMEPKLAWANARINEIVFYEQFYKDQNCPSGVKNILFSLIGLGKGNLEENNMLNLLHFRYHSVELWLDSIAQKSSP